MYKSFALVVVLAISGCNCSDNTRTNTTTRSQTQVKTQSHLFNAKDFDLETIAGLVKSGKIGDPQGLEEFINSDNGVNNVDIDKDGSIDYVRVVEAEGTGIVLDFLAVPSSGQGEHKNVATLKMNHNTTTNEVAVEAAYPSYAHGYRDHYYSYHTPYRPGMSVGQALFLSYMLSPGRAMYAPVYSRPIGYSPRSVYSPSQRSTKRTIMRTTTKVSPVKKAARPANYKPSKTATKTSSKFKASNKTKGNSFSSRKGASKSFSKRDDNKTKKKASAFGAKSSTAKKSGFGSSSAKKSSGWGSSGGSRKKSSWGSSSSSRSRSSFGGSRSRSSGRRR